MVHVIVPSYLHAIYPKEEHVPMGSHLDQIRIHTLRYDTFISDCTTFEEI